MRGSDIVDIAVEVLPKDVVRVLLLAFIAVMTVFDWWAPALWYVHDKAAGITEAVLSAYTPVLTP
ncbi:hypothetical protein ON058_00465 [Demequina sp. B12]|uniref:hypothetical protein n=1 Tax=Demequina sp. B12 TaxID=2992757 RepID=UPI00237C5295|nr:hypothetical protein [Demequina sp. B12]MDE0571887.1 hypothetical protein [Demequina sp. B12]